MTREGPRLGLPAPTQRTVALDDPSTLPDIGNALEFRPAPRRPDVRRRHRRGLIPLAADPLRNHRERPPLEGAGK